MMGEPTEWQSGMEGKRELSRLRSILIDKRERKEETNPKAHSAEKTKSTLVSSLAAIACSI